MWLHSLASDNKLVPRESFNSIDEAEVPPSSETYLDIWRHRDE